MVNNQRCLKNDEKLTGIRIGLVASFCLFVEKELSNDSSKKTNKMVLVLPFLFLIDYASIPIVYSQKAIILNFDDDWKGQMTYAVPILEKYGFKATFFVTTGCLTYQNSSFCNNAGGESAMTWEDIKLLAEMGHDIQSHGVSHKDLTTVSAADLEYEIGQSKQS